MLHAHGTFNGTGAALYFGIGFLPDWVKVQNLEDADVAVYFWNIHMERVLETAHGIRYYTAAGLLGDPLIGQLVQISLVCCGLIPHNLPVPPHHTLCPIVIYSQLFTIPT